MTPELPSLRPPFALRARVLTPLAAGGTYHEPDGLLLVDAAGRLTFVGAAGDRPAEAATALDLRPWVVLPGLIDLHAHLPQLPNAGLGAGLDVLTWLDRYIFPLERGFDEAAAERLAPIAWRAFAAAGTTTAVVHGAVYEASLDAAFQAAAAHGIRAVIGKVMMDRLTYDPTIEPATILERSLRESSDLIARWHGRDGGRLRYAVTPRFAVSCTAEMLRESAALADSTGAYWQTHLSEDRGEIAEVARLFPDALDYVDVYERAGGLGVRTILAHAVHLSDRELGRLVATGSHVAHCPVSNLFLASGVMPLARYLEAGLSVGLGSDVAGGPELSIFTAMRVGFYAQNAMRVAGLASGPALGPFDWLRLGTLGGAQALGIDDLVGSLEPGKEADLIAVDPAFVASVPGSIDDDPEDLMSRLMFRAHPDMVRAAWVRGRALEGPGARG
ncbi:MAG: amidohydrolase family protein [Candidatus Limnocylindrales bacterium]|nr:amidohydrolase family protein [Candidatus Limnocylindrales bacterium]